MSDYAGRFRVEPCCCGGFVVADDFDWPHWRLVAVAIREHQRTERHQTWRAMGGLDFDPELMGREAVA
jgi:hypothetical protein